MDPKDAAEYLNTLTDKQGVAVATVSDGWVFHFSREKLQQMVDAIDADGADKLVVFVKNSASLPAN